MLQPIWGRKRGFAAPPTPVFCDRSPCVPTEKERTPPHREHVHWPECSIPKRPFRASAGEGPGQTGALLYHWVSIWEGSHRARVFPDRKGASGPQGGLDLQCFVYAFDHFQEGQASFFPQIFPHQMERSCGNSWIRGISRRYLQKMRTVLPCGHRRDGELGVGM